MRLQKCTFPKDTLECKNTYVRKAATFQLKQQRFGFSFSHCESLNSVDRKSVFGVAEHDHDGKQKFPSVDAAPTYSPENFITTIFYCYWISFNSFLSAHGAIT